MKKFSDKIISLRALKYGDMFRLYADGKLYTRGYYDRKSNMYCCPRINSVGRPSWFYPDTLVFHASIFNS